MKRLDVTLAELYPLIKEIIESGGEYRLFPRGRSMLPLLREGKDSVVLVAPASLKKGDICLYRRKSGAFVLHRLMKREQNGTLTFLGDNQLDLERGISPEQVIAVVSYLYRGEKPVYLNKCSYRCYVRLHSVLWLRRILFLPKRAMGKLLRLFRKKA